MDLTDTQKDDEWLDDTISGYTNTIKYSIQLPSPPQLCLGTIVVTHLAFFFLLLHEQFFQPPVKRNKNTVLDRIQL